MAYTVGAVHTLVGTGDAAVAGPVGLKYSLAVPPNLGRELGTPDEYYRAGRLTLGNEDGWLSSTDLRAPNGLIYPLPDSLTLLGWTLTSGVTATVRELVPVADVADPLARQVWDRNAAQVTGNTVLGLPGVTGVTQALSYTVPTARRLWLTHAHLQILRLDGTPASGLNTPAGWWTINGATVQVARLSRLTTVATASIAGPVVLPAGHVLAALGANSETGGWIYLDVSYAGILFDA